MGILPEMAVDRLCYTNPNPRANGKSILAVLALQAVLVAWPA